MSCPDGRGRRSTTTAVLPLRCPAGPGPSLLRVITYASPVVVLIDQRAYLVGHNPHHGREPGRQLSDIDHMEMKKAAKRRLSSVNLPQNVCHKVPHLSAEGDGRAPATRDGNRRIQDRQLPVRCKKQQHRCRPVDDKLERHNPAIDGLSECFTTASEAAPKQLKHLDDIAWDAAALRHARRLSDRFLRCHTLYTRVPASELRRVHNLGAFVGQAET